MTTLFSIGPIATRSLVMNVTHFVVYKRLIMGVSGRNM
jgi:hypothetical protein